MRERPILVADESIRRRTLIQEILVPEPTYPVRCKITEGSHQLTKSCNGPWENSPTAILQLKITKGKNADYHLYNIAS